MWNKVRTAPRAFRLNKLTYFPASKCPKCDPKRAKKLPVNSLSATTICPECPFWVGRGGKGLITTWGIQKDRLGLPPFLNFGEKKKAK